MYMCVYLTSLYIYVQTKNTNTSHSASLQLHLEIKIHSMARECDHNGPQRPNNIQTKITKASNSFKLNFKKDSWDGVARV